MDVMTKFANNIKNSDCITINKELRELQLNASECTVLSRVEKDSIVKFISSTDKRI